MAGSNRQDPSGKPLVIVSCDTHVGPKMSQLRPYCPTRYRADFDMFAKSVDRAWVDAQRAFNGRVSESFLRNTRTEGHFDGAARRRDLDRDGVAAEVIFHGSQNGQPIPFHPFSDIATAQDSAWGSEHLAIGLRMYNQWLADLVSEAPDRHVGLAQLPMWDIEAAVSEASWAADAGLRGINFPAPGPDLQGYNHVAWEPLWAACADLRLPLVTHAGSGGGNISYTGPEAEALQALEHGGWFARRALHWMIFGGVFHRHPTLTLVLTEQPGLWWLPTLTELDSVHRMQHDVLRERVPEPPSSYARRNVRIGASFLARFEAEAAVHMGYDGLVLWGSDYPHMEGTFQHQPRLAGGEETVGRQALRHTFAGLPEASVAAMAGTNAVETYSLDRDRLAAVAARIGAPTFVEVTRPLDRVPAEAGLLAFRTFGPWA